MPLNILVLEDNPDDAELIVLALEQSGLDIRSRLAANQTDYLRELSPEIDLILSDFYLPDYDAIKALEQRNAQQLDIPFIMITGSLTEEIAAACIQLGAADYLMKDRLSRLGNAVNNALHAKNLRDEKRRTEEELRRSEEKFRNLFEQAMDIILIIDPSTHQILDVNFAVETFLGYSKAELLHQPYHHFFPEAKQLTQQVQAYLPEVLVSHKNGSQLPMDITANLISWDTGQAIRLTMRDVSERLEAKALHQEILIEKELRELKNRFVSMVSHEFRTPLATIQLHVDMLRKYPLEGEKRTQVFGRIQTAITEMLRLIEDVLTYNKAEGGWLEFVPESLDLVEFCGEIIEQTRLTLATHTHEIVFTNLGMPVPLSLDKNLIGQIISNLMSNAVKYSPSGGKIELALEWHREQVLVRVSDEGIGIAETDQKRLFQSFHRGNNVQGIAGTGLGLAITQQAVRLHGGTIQLESELGKGSTFTVAFPMPPSHA